MSSHEEKEDKYYSRLERKYYKGTKEGFIKAHEKMYRCWKNGNYLKYHPICGRAYLLDHKYTNYFLGPKHRRSSSRHCWFCTETRIKGGTDWSIRPIFCDFDGCEWQKTNRGPGMWVPFGWENPERAEYHRRVAEFLKGQPEYRFTFVGIKENNGWPEVWEIDRELYNARPKPGRS